MKVWQIQLAGVVLSTLLLSGCAGLLLGGAAVGVGMVHDRRTTGTLVDDQTIELNATNALGTQLPRDSRVSVTSYNGTVLLVGQVASEEVRQQAEAVVRSVTPSVREVYNELVVGQPGSFPSGGRDSFLTSRVKTALFQVHLTDFDPTRVKVITEQGVVYLMGLVRPAEADASANVASQVSGVRQVITLFEYIN